MDKKTLAIVGGIGAVILVLIAVVLGMQTQTTELSAEEVLRINNEVYEKKEFVKFIQYTLYKNSGDTSIDEEAHATELANGASKESLFVSDTLQSFYQLKVFGVYAKSKEIAISEDTVAQIEADYEANKERLALYGVEKEDFIQFEKEQAVINLIQSNPSTYVTLPDDIYQKYLENFSGDDLKSYTFRMVQVSYTTDTENESGELISGDREEKDALIRSMVERVKAGTSFEEVASSGDTRLIFVGNGIQLAPSMLEHSAGFLLEQKLGSKELTEAVKQTAVGEMTDIIDTGSLFQVALVENVEEGIVGEAKSELVDLLISNSFNEIIYSVVSDVEVNHSAVSRITIQ